MKLDRHIAVRFLTDDTFALEIVEGLYPRIHEHADDEVAKESPQFRAAANLYHLVSKKDQRAYFITNSVMDNLSLLKVKKGTEYAKTGDLGEEVQGTVITYDWTVFHHLSNRKVTLIFPDNVVFRILIDTTFISFCHIRCENFDWDGNHANVFWTLGFVDKVKKRVSKNWEDKQVQDIELLMYQLMCFLYLAENEEVVVEAGHKHGTRKSGKVINTLPLPLTIVTSKWNITSIRTEGFPVSGHFRLQPYKDRYEMIFIQPFKKHGYVRRAKSEGEK